MAGPDPLSPTSSYLGDIDTPRLTLRIPSLADFEDSAIMWADPAVARFIGGKPSTREEAWARLMRYIGHWTALGYGFWTIREAATGRFVGETGFADFKREIDPPLSAVPDMGWSLAAWAHGQGYASEAVQAALAWGEAHFGSGRATCIIDPDNAASMRVAAKAGFRELRLGTYKDGPTVVFER